MKKLISILLLISALTFCLASCTCERCDGDGMMFCGYCLGEGKRGTLCKWCDGDRKCSSCTDGLIRNWGTCSSCHGKGCYKCDNGKWWNYKECKFCDGKGVCSDCNGTGYEVEPTTCVYCNGIGERPCVECNN